VASLGLAPAKQYTNLVPYVWYSTSTISRIGDMFAKRLFGAIRNREPEQVVVQDALRGLRIGYPSRSSALAALNRDLRRMFYLKKPTEGQRMHSILDQCLVDTGKERWLTHAKTIQIQWWDNSPGKMDMLPRYRSIFVGSQNMSFSAWSKESYECGVLFPIVGYPWEEGIHANVSMSGLSYNVDEAWFNR